MSNVHPKAETLVQQQLIQIKKELLQIRIDLQHLMQKQASRQNKGEIAQLRKRITNT